MNDHLYDSEFEHEQIDVASILPSIGNGDDLVIVADQQPENFPELKQPERDLGAFVVGKLAPHKRINRKIKEVGDDVLLSYKMHNNDVVEYGFGKILKVLNDGTDGSKPEYHIHWYESTNGKWTGQFRPLWNEVKAGKKTYSGAKAHNSHKAYTDTIVDDGQIFAHGKLRTKGRKLTLKCLRKLCGLEDCDFKIHDHDDDCEC